MPASSMIFFKVLTLFLNYLRRENLARKRAASRESGPEFGSLKRVRVVVVVQRSGGPKDGPPFFFLMAVFLDDFPIPWIFFKGMRSYMMVYECFQKWRIQNL